MSDPSVFSNAPYSPGPSRLDDAPGDVDEYFLRLALIRAISARIKRRAERGGWSDFDHRAHRLDLRMREAAIEFDASTESAAHEIVAHLEKLERDSLRFEWLSARLSRLSPGVLSEIGLLGDDEDIGRRIDAAILGGR